LLYSTFLCCMGCKKNNSTPETPIVPEKPFTTYTILNSTHYAQGYDSTHFVFISTNDLKFTVKFDSSCIYTSQYIDNSQDVNKLYGFSDNRASHHDFSARIGWAWYYNALRLFGYTYNNSVRSITQLSIVPIGAEISCRIQVDTASKNYLFTINGQTTAMPRAATTPQAIGYRLYPYFGGGLTAPHDVTIMIREEQ